MTSDDSLVATNAPLTRKSELPPRAAGVVFMVAVIVGGVLAALVAIAISLKS